MKTQNESEGDLQSALDIMWTVPYLPINVLQHNLPCAYTIILDIYTVSDIKYNGITAFR